VNIMPSDNASRGRQTRQRGSPRRVGTAAVAASAHSSHHRGEPARGERDLLPVAVAAVPDGEPDQLQAIELPTSEVEFGVLRAEMYPARLR
jgi:hypothetical protein